MACFSTSYGFKALKLNISNYVLLPNGSRQLFGETRRDEKFLGQIETNSRLLVLQNTQFETFEKIGVMKKSGRDETRQHFSSRLAEKFSTPNFSTHPYLDILDGSVNVGLDKKRQIILKLKTGFWFGYNPITLHPFAEQ